MTDITDKISDKIKSPPDNDIDRFATTMTRRSDLTDKKVKEILKNVFNTIDPDMLGTPELEYQYNIIAKKL